MRRLLAELVEGRPDLPQPGLRRHGLHLADEPRQVADEVRVQLQVAVPAALDPERVVRLPRQPPQLLPVRPVHHVVVGPLQGVSGGGCNLFDDVYSDVISSAAQATLLTNTCTVFMIDCS